MKAFIIKEKDQIVQVNDLHGLAVFDTKEEANTWINHYKDVSCCSDEKVWNGLRIVPVDICENIALQKAAPDLLAACKTAAEDCRMALSGEWDKSDEGFKDTLELLETVINKATQNERARQSANS